MSETTVKKAALALPHPVINTDHCKGCGLCIAACPKQVLRFSKSLNRWNVQSAEYVGSGCIGCNSCFYSCPEPYAIEVHALEKKNKQGTPSQ
jgi:2-oxoisovalerate ferredoxin oxidoreductase delta subunit